jgi:hypothetical protein
VSIDGLADGLTLGDNDKDGEALGDILGDAEGLSEGEAEGDGVGAVINCSLAATPSFPAARLIFPSTHFEIPVKESPSIQFVKLISKVPFNTLLLRGSPEGKRVTLST